MPKFKKGQSGNPKGKPKGTKNKIPADLIREVLDISEQLKQENKGLLDCARETPKWFYEHFLKVLLPKNIDVTGSISVEEIFKKLDG